MADNTPQENVPAVAGEDKPDDTAKPLTLKERGPGKRDVVEESPVVVEDKPMTEEQAREAVLTWARDFYGTDNVEARSIAYNADGANWTAELSVGTEVTASVTFLLDEVHGLYALTIDGEEAAVVIARDRRPRGENGKLLSPEERIALLEERLDRFERKHGPALEPISG